MTTTPLWPDDEAATLAALWADAHAAVIQTYEARTRKCSHCYGDAAVRIVLVGRAPGRVPVVGCPKCGKRGDVTFYFFGRGMGFEKPQVKKGA